MSWRKYFTTHFGPGALCGFTLGDWLRFLAENRFAIDPPYWPRAFLITAGCNGEERSLEQYEDAYQAYFEQRSLIPPGRLYDLGYEVPRSRSHRPDAQTI